MDDSEPGSLFVVVFHYDDSSFSIQQLETTLGGGNSGPEQIRNTNVDDHLKERFDVAAEQQIENTNVDNDLKESFDVAAEQNENTNVDDDLKESFDVAAEQIEYTNVDDLKEHVVSFDVAKTPLPIRWSVSPPTSSTGDLYLLPNWCAAGNQPLHGYKFNFRTGSFQNICLPPSISNERHFETSVPVRNILSAVIHGGHIYRLELHTLPRPHFYLVESFFDCYDPVNNSWKPLKPFPPFQYISSVEATAVLDDTILFNVYPSGLWAYDVYRNEWVIVEFDDERCLGMDGEAVVLQNTIYALTGPRSDVILVLSIEKKKGSGGDLVFHCSLSSEIPIPDLRSTFPWDEKGRLPSSDQASRVRTTHLLHLGKVDFCLVRSCIPPLGSYDHKPILVTYMRLTGETEMTVLSNHWLKIRHDRLSDVALCFSLPKCKTTALEEGKRFVFELDPFTPKGNCSTYVRDLPPIVTATQLENGLTKFGPIKRDGIHFKQNKEGKGFSLVEQLAVGGVNSHTWGISGKT